METAVSETILVTYATRYGSTREVADAVAATLRDNGCEVAFQPARDVPTVDGYAAVVLGTPLYMGHWLRDATRFLTRHRETLVGRKIAVFTLGPTRLDEKEWRAVRAELDREQARYPWLTPVASTLFGGRYDPATLDLSHKLLAALPASPLHELPASDVRDWQAIRAWAADLASTLRRPSDR
jgi:menaquinone-dependent protoporphyrinogen oxidase